MKYPHAPGDVCGSPDLPDFGTSYADDGASHVDDAHHFGYLATWFSFAARLYSSRYPRQIKLNLPLGSPAILNPKSFRAMMILE